MHVGFAPVFMNTTYELATDTLSDPEVYRRDLALADLDECIRLEPTFSRGYVDRAAIASRKGNYDSAIADFSEAIRLTPKSAAAFLGRGVAIERQRRFDKALADFVEVTRLNPKSAVAYYDAGNAYRETKQLDQALASYSEAIRLDPVNPQPYVDRGIIRYLKGQFDEAIADYDEALRLRPQHAESYFNRASAYRYKGRTSRRLPIMKRRSTSIPTSRSSNGSCLSLASRGLDCAWAGRRLRALHESCCGTFETCRPVPPMSDHRGRPEVIGASSNRRE